MTPSRWGHSPQSYPRRNFSIVLPFIMFYFFFHLILIFSLHCQLFLRISGITKICNIKITSQCKILIVPEEGWFGQPKYSTYIKTILRCAGFCLYFLQWNKPYIELRIWNGVMLWSSQLLKGNWRQKNKHYLFSLYTIHNKRQTNFRVRISTKEFMWGWG